MLGGALQALRCYEGKYSFAQTSLSGKAAARMQEVTGQSGYTIHRLLEFKPPGCFSYHEDNPLPFDIIILDEVSLVGGEIFLDLIRAIPTGSKLIILGDMGQLESIGTLNIADDLYHSSDIHTVELTQIHRQAQKSGIVMASKSIREGNQLFNRNFEGVMTIGELEDMHLIISKKDSIRRKTVECFNKYWNENNDIMDIQILAPVKERGEASLYNLNMDIQNIVNPHQKNKKEYKIEYGNDKVVTFREGDKIMNIRNNYKTVNTKGQKVPIFNGWVGMLTGLDNMLEEATIYFPIINDAILVDTNLLKSNMVLGYASTIHKYQGSSAKIVIGVLDNSTPPNMRTKELLYTLITRTEKECTVIAQNSAFRGAVETSGILGKYTFLVEHLEERFCKKI